jgi:hypothetical protein
MTKALRNNCRNPHCRTKLKAPVENEHHAFCCRAAGCALLTFSPNENPATGRMLWRGSRPLCSWGASTLGPLGQLFPAVTCSARFLWRLPSSFGRETR